MVRRRYTMKYLVIALSLLLSVVSVMADDNSYFVQFNTLQELHDDFKTSPILSAGYIQGVMDMESLEATSSNDWQENAWHACLASHPELRTAPKISVLVDEYYAAHPDWRAFTAAIAVVTVVNKACGIANAHEGLGIQMGAPSTAPSAAPKPKPSLP